MSKSQWVNSGKVFCLPCWCPICLLMHLEQLIILVNDTKIMVHLAHVLTALKVTLISSWKVCVRVVLKKKKKRVVLWPPDVKHWFTGKDPDVGKDGEQEEKEATEDKMVEWHHQLNGHESEQTLGDSQGQGDLACRSPWSCKESDMT